jgi:hypothetical protein
MMKIGTITLLQSFVILLSIISTTVARDKDSNLRQDTGPTRIEQHLFDGNTEIQVDKESSYGFLKAFTNHLRPWWTKHVVKLDRSNPVQFDKEHGIIEAFSSNNNGRELLSSWCDPTTPVRWHP